MNYVTKFEIMVSQFITSGGPNLPSWLQAFAAIVALGISVWAVRTAGSAERKREELRATGVAVAVHMDLLKTRLLVQNAVHQLNELQITAASFVGQTVAGRVMEGKIPILPMVDRNIDQFFLLGRAAGPICLQLVSVIFQYNDFVDECTGRVMAMGPADWREAVSQLIEHLNFLDKILQTAIHHIEVKFADVVSKVRIEPTSITERNPKPPLR